MPAVSSTPPTAPTQSTWPDVATHAINAIVILGALALVYGLYDAATKGTTFATMFGAATPIVVSLVGLYFGVVVGKTGLDQAKAANSAAAAATTSLAAERALNASRGV